MNEAVNALMQAYGYAQAEAEQEYKDQVSCLMRGAAGTANDYAYAQRAAAAEILESLEG